MVEDYRDHQTITTDSQIMAMDTHLIELVIELIGTRQRLPGLPKNEQTPTESTEIYRQWLALSLNEQHSPAKTSQSIIRASIAQLALSIKSSPAFNRPSLMEVKPELQDLGASSQRYRSMIHILGQIEKLQAVPEQLDARIADKHFLAAVKLLQDALRMIRRSEMESIGALADLRVYFSNQETLNDAVPAERQKDSFCYIHVLLEALDRLGCLDLAVDRIEQRLPVELFTIVERTNQEVDLRHPMHLRDGGRIESILDLHVRDDKERSAVLDDLLWTLYSKFEAIAEGHRVVHDVVVGIARRNGIRHPDRLGGSFKELWKLYQSELRSLLHDYIATDENNPTRLGRSQAVESNPLQSTRRDRAKKIFQMVEVDQKSGGLTAEQEELDKILQNSVPGLATKPQRRSGIQRTKDRVSKGGPATHKLLVESSVFNIGILLPPSLTFLQRLRDIVPPNSDIAISTLTTFLDDFLVNIFLPQLEESVTELCAQSYTGRDAFQEDPQWRQWAPRPILKSTASFLTLIKTFCRLLDNLPEDQNFTQLIISQLIAYYDKCYGWYRSMVQRVSMQTHSDTELKPAASMAEAGGLRNILDTLWSSRETEDGSLVRQENEHLASKTREAPLVPTDIISDRRTVASLCLIYTSMQWLASGLAQLRHVVPQSESYKRTSSRPQQTRRWTLLELSKSTSNDAAVQLPLNQEAATTFDGIVGSMRSMALDALFTLQVDMRCGVAHMAARMLDAPYLLPYPTNNPNPEVLTLNSDLLSSDDALHTYLSEDEHRFMMNGLAALLDQLLVTNASRIRSMDVNGCGRMQLNILVLQQNLKAIEGDVSLPRSSHFFEIFVEGADTIVARAKKAGGKVEFSLDECKVLVELCHSEGLQSTQRELSVQAKKNLANHHRQLEEYMS
ncbi:MAG: hypothetical protein Q9212_002530 [Teloschistes hypoglaucus]